MRKIALAENFYQYQFPSRPGEHFGFNIFVLVNGNDALLIDAGFKDHAAAVKDDLSASGIEPSRIIISHFHEDHFLGLQAFPHLQVFGGELYAPGLPKHFQPTNILSATSSLEFGDFNLRFRLMTGHSACDLFTLINNRFIHVGDAILCSNDGLPLLPSVQFERLSGHIASLEALREYKSHTFLLGHGNPISGAANILEAIDNRLKYLRTVFQRQSRISYEEATKECTCDFLHKEWHEYLYP